MLATAQRPLQRRTTVTLWPPPSFPLHSVTGLRLGTLTCKRCPSSRRAPRSLHGITFSEPHAFQLAPGGAVHLVRLSDGAALCGRGPQLYAEAPQVTGPL